MLEAFLNGVATSDKFKQKGTVEPERSKSEPVRLKEEGRVFHAKRVAKARKDMTVSLVY